MDGSGQRDLTVNLRLVADDGNVKTAKGIANEVRKAQREIQSAQGSTIDHLRKLDELVPRTNQQIARGLREQQAGYRRLGAAQTSVHSRRIGMIESTHQLAKALGSAAHGMIDLTHSSEEQSRSSHTFISDMEDKAGSVLEFATAAAAAADALKRLKALRGAGVGRGLFAGGATAVGTTTAASGAGSVTTAAAGTTTTGTVASGIAATAAASAAAVIGIAMATAAIKEQVDGTSTNAGSYTNTVGSIFSDPNSIGGMAARWNPVVMASSFLLEQQADRAVARTESMEKKSRERFNRGQKENAFFTSDSFQRYHQTNRSIALLEHRRNRLNLTRGLDGTQRGLAANTFDLQDARQRASVAPVVGGSLAKNENFQDRIKAQRDIQRLLEQRVGLERKAHEESIRSKQVELSLSQKQLAAQEQRRIDARRQVDSVAERLASLKGRDLRKFNAAVKSTSDGEVTFQEAQQLRGIPVFEKFFRDATFKQAKVNDTNGLLDRLIKAQEIEAKKERKIALSVKAQNNVVVELQKNIDVDKVVDGLKEKIGDALNFEAELRQALSDYSASVAEHQNAFNQ